MHLFTITLLIDVEVAVLIIAIGSEEFAETLALESIFSKCFIEIWALKFYFHCRLY